MGMMGMAVRVTWLGGIILSHVRGFLPAQKKISELFDKVIINYGLSFTLGINQLDIYVASK